MSVYVYLSTHCTGVSVDYMCMIGVSADAAAHIQKSEVSTGSVCPSVWFGAGSHGFLLDL